MEKPLPEDRGLKVSECPAEVTVQKLLFISWLAIHGLFRIWGNIAVYNFRESICREVNFATDFDG